MRSKHKVVKDYVNWEYYGPKDSETGLQLRRPRNPDADTTTVNYRLPVDPGRPRLEASEDALVPYDPEQRDSKRQRTDEGPGGESETPQAKAAAANNMGKGHETALSPFPYSALNYPETHTVKHHYTRTGGWIPTALTDDGPNRSIPIIVSNAVFNINDHALGFSSFDNYLGAAYSPLDLTYYSWMIKMYKYYSVISMQLTLKFKYYGLRESNTMTNLMANAALPKYTHQFQEPELELLWCDYAQIDGSPTTKSYDALLNQPRMQHKSFQVYTGATGFNGPLQECELKVSYGHEDYEKIVDVATDALDNVWSQVGVASTLPHYLKVFLRPRFYSAGFTDVAHWMITSVDIGLDYVVQYKQLDTKFANNLYLGDPTFP